MTGGLAADSACALELASTPPQGELSADLLDAGFGGSATGRWSQTELISWIPPEFDARDLPPGHPRAEHLPGHHDHEPAAAMFTSYSPPHPMALRATEVDAITNWQAPVAPPDHPPGRAIGEAVPWADLPAADTLGSIVTAANDAWWRLRIDTVTAYRLTYSPGDDHTEHTDMHPGSMQRKLSLTVQLSDSDDYLGGDLQLRCWGHLLTMPRIRGTVIAFPGWIPHRVTPVESGERKSLVVWAWGPPVT